MADSYWRNWARTQQCAPVRIEHPASEEELVAIVAGAAEDGLRVKAVGAGHSFTDIACTSGVLLCLDRYNQILAVDGTRVTVQAGITIAELNEQLDQRGLALPNLGDIAYQTIAGATATATHGTGAELGNISTQIVGMRIITGDGRVVECSADTEADVYAAARVGVGALGLVSTVTLETVPAFNLHAVEEPRRLDELLDEVDDLADAHDHFEFFYVPHTGWALTKANNRTTEPLRPRSRFEHVRDKLVMENLAFDVLCRVGRRAPRLIPRLNRVIPSTGTVDYVDKSYKVFASPRMVRFNEMEYAVPREAGAEALRRVRRLIDDTGLTVNFPIEFRFTKGDDIPLSTASGRDTCYIAVHVYRGMPNDQYFQAVEAVMDEYDGRPHWGKMHYQTVDTLAHRYPRWDEFQKVRRSLDPAGVFANPYTDRVLGPTP